MIVNCEKCEWTGTEAEAMPQQEERVSFEDRCPTLAATVGLALMVIGMLGFAVILTAVEGVTR